MNGSELLATEHSCLVTAGYLQNLLLKQVSGCFSLHQNLNGGVVGKGPFKNQVRTPTLLQFLPTEGTDYLVQVQ